MQCVWQCLTPLDLAMFRNLWIGMILRGFSAHATQEKLYEVFLERPTCVTCDIATWSRLRETKHACLCWSKHIYRNTAWTFLLDYSVMSIVHLSRYHCIKVVTLLDQCICKWMQSLPSLVLLRSAGLRQRRFPSTWWLVTVRKLQAMSMMLYKC